MCSFSSNKKKPLKKQTVESKAKIAAFLLTYCWLSQTERKQKRQRKTHEIAPKQCRRYLLAVLCRTFLFASATIALEFIFAEELFSGSPVFLFLLLFFGQTLYYLFLFSSIRKMISPDGQCVR